MKLAFAHFPKTAGTSVMNSLLRLIDDMQVIYLNSEAQEGFNVPELTKMLGDMRYLSPLNTLSNSPSFCGHFLAWKMAQFLGPEVSREYKWFTAVRDPLDWVISYYNFSHQISNDPYHFAFGWKVKSSFADWFTDVEANPQTSFAPDRTARDAMAFARSLNMDIVPLPEITAYIDNIYISYGVPPLQLVRDNVSIRYLHKDDLSLSERKMIEARFPEDQRLYDLAQNNFSIPDRLNDAPSIKIVTPRKSADFACLSGTGPVFIYGNSMPAKLVLHAIQKQSGVDFAGFINSSHSGTIGCHKIFYADDILSKISANSTVIIASQAYGTLIKRLIRAGVTKLWDGYPYALALMKERPIIR